MSVSPQVLIEIVRTLDYSNTSKDRLVSLIENRDSRVL